MPPVHTLSTFLRIIHLIKALYFCLLPETLLRFMKENMAELEGEIQNQGIEAAQQAVKKELDGWKEIHISLAIIGDAGVGKSCFINAIRG